MSNDTAESIGLEALLKAKAWLEAQDWREDESVYLPSYHYDQWQAAGFDLTGFVRLGNGPIPVGGLTPWTAFAERR